MVIPCCCFPGDTPVTTKSGVKRMDQLHFGDKVLTASKNGGVQKWTTFFVWGHREVKTAGDFVVMTVSSGKVLKVTGDHLIFVEGRVAKRAGLVVPGDKVCMFTESGTLTEETVISIRSETLSGIYAPFTMSGDFIANGFLVGCYADITSFELAHASVAPLRALYKLHISSRTEVGKEGLHKYVGSLFKARDILPEPFRELIN